MEKIGPNSWKAVRTSSSAQYFGSWPTNILIASESGLSFMILHRFIESHLHIKSFHLARVFDSHSRGSSLDFCEVGLWKEGTTQSISIS